MPLDLCDYENKARKAVEAFWQTRADAVLKQKTSGKSDQGERAGVTGGKNMDGFANLMIDIVKANGLVAALEFKSHVGPSFGNNFNNRTEEAIGTSHDLWTAYREGAFGKQARPFIGWLMVVEDSSASRSPVKDQSPHFH